MNEERLLLNDLDAEQERAVVAEASPLVVIAGAGSGKTRVLTRRIAYRGMQGSADPNKTLAVTFTRKAAEELIDRLETLGVDGVTAGTFHSFAYRTLRDFWSDRGTHRPRRVISSKSSILYRIAGGQESGSSVLREIAGEIEWAKARRIPPTRYLAAAADRRTSVEHSSIAAYYERYEMEKRKAGGIDFEDMLDRLADAISTDSRLAAELHVRYRHIYVDEFQDVNPLQYRLLEAISGSDTDLFLVGDPCQAIFSFTGADSGFLTGIESRRPGSMVLTLSANYRSTPEIIGAANAVLLDHGAIAGTPPALPLLPTLPSGEPPVIAAYEDGEAEAAAIARAIRDSHSNSRPWRDFAVFYRTSAQSELLESALVAQKIPFTVRDGTAFAMRDEIAAVLEKLVSTDPAPGLTLEAAVAEAVADVDATEEARAQLDKLAGLAAEFGASYAGSQSGSNSFTGFVAFVRAAFAEGQAGVDPGNRVSLLTLHAAKGLEFPHVFICGVEKGYLPISHAVTAPAREEERRLLFVGITRAKERLTLTWAAERSFGSSTVSREPSPLLLPVRAALDLIKSARIPSRDWAAEIREQRDRIQMNRRSG